VNRQELHSRSEWSKELVAKRPSGDGIAAMLEEVAIKASL
jgi:hypothetical protein